MYEAKLSKRIIIKKEVMFQPLVMKSYSNKKIIYMQFVTDSNTFSVDLFYLVDLIMC